MMRLDTGQHMRMDLRMKMSPRMIQSMEILQLPALALEERIEQELAENPVLELVENLAEPRPEGSAETGGEAIESGEKPIVVADTPQGAGEDFARAADLSETYGDQWEQNTLESADYHPPSRRIRDDGERDGKMDAMANTPARGVSLVEQLLEQWRFVECDPQVRRAGEHLITFIDDDGYIRVAMDQIMRQAPPGVTQEQIEQAWELVRQRLEPTGIGSRNLAECMAVQLRLAEKEAEQANAGLDELHAIHIAQRLVQSHLKDIEMNRLPRIAERTGLSLEDIRIGLDRLRRLDPRPGRQLAPETPQVVVPDVIVEYDSVNDRYVAALARGRVPSLRINPNYRRLAKDRTQDSQTRQFLSDRMYGARWLIESIEQRNSTVLRVANAVIDAQRDFLDHGPQHLKPLPMMQVADQLGVHVGTISRAVADKYVQTPRGIYPLRMFFTSGTESSTGQEVSWSAIQAKLREMIDNEPPDNPYSDDAIVEELNRQGIDIARRTIAKYRKQLNIPPARRRKRF